ncbi:MAG: iron export ABC transporter permease subunit FetB [Gammaproteobacteria bacterium]|nr:iron export ABC transporter permease subunit FetB [Gammaproteobacteria bacterium]
MITLSQFDLLIASTLVLLLALISMRMRTGITGQLVIAAIRTALQLTLIGLVLKTLFANVQLGWVALLSLFMLLIAGREVMVRQERRFRGWWGYAVGTFSMFLSSFAVTIFALIAILGNDPWYAPQYAIPLLGMMLGNTMSGIAIAMDRLTHAAWEQRNQIEARLMLGERWDTAISEYRRQAVRSGLIPIINAMAAAGVVSLPGMMTGQILAGAAPVEAVKYQILIMFLVSAGTGLGTLAAVSIGARHLFDKRQRLCLDRLRER